MIPGSVEDVLRSLCISDHTPEVEKVGDAGYNILLGEASLDPDYFLPYGINLYKAGYIIAGTTIVQREAVDDSGEDPGIAPFVRLWVLPIGHELLRSGSE